MIEHTKTLVFSNDRIQRRVVELAGKINHDYQGREVILLGVLNGVFMFFADLAKNLSIPVKVDFIRLASYGAQTCSSGCISMTKDVEVDITGKHVLVVEDITDSGLTMNWLKQHLTDKGALSVKTCVLIDKRKDATSKSSWNMSGSRSTAAFWSVTAWILMAITDACPIFIISSTPTDCRGRLE